MSLVRTLINFLKDASKSGRSGSFAGDYKNVSRGNRVPSQSDLTRGIHGLLTGTIGVKVPRLISKTIPLAIIHANRKHLDSGTLKINRLRTLYRNPKVNVTYAISTPNSRTVEYRTITMSEKTYLANRYNLDQFGIERLEKAGTPPIEHEYISAVEIKRF